jgi:Na+/melibiose symporter-like transporter
MTLVPFILCVLGAIIMQWYKLDETMHKQIRSDLEAKHAIS